VSFVLPLSRQVTSVRREREREREEGDGQMVQVQSRTGRERTNSTDLWVRDVFY
jgi:hypothetical protein